MPAIDAAVGFNEPMSCFKTENGYITRSDNDILQHGPLDKNLDGEDKRKENGPALRVYIKYACGGYILVDRMSNKIRRRKPL